MISPNPVTTTRELLMSALTIPAGAAVAYLLLHAYLPLVALGLLFLVGLGFAVRDSLPGTVSAGAGYLAVAMLFGLPALLNTDPAVTYVPGSVAWYLLVIVLGPSVLTVTRWMR